MPELSTEVGDNGPVITTKCHPREGTDGSHGYLVSSLKVCSCECPSSSASLKGGFSLEPKVRSTPDYVSGRFARNVPGEKRAEKSCPDSSKRKGSRAHRKLPKEVCNQQVEQETGKRLRPASPSEDPETRGSNARRSRRSSSPNHCLLCFYGAPQRIMRELPEVRPRARRRLGPNTLAPGLGEDGAWSPTSFRRKQRANP